MPRTLMQTALKVFVKLASSIGSSLIGFIQAGVGAVLRTVQAKLRETVSPMDFGAVGDGVADDRAAMLLAFASGYVVDGCGRTYGIAGNLQPVAGFKGLTDCTLKQLTPTGSDRRTLYMNGVTGFVLEKVIIDRNGNTSGGAIGDDAGMYLANCSNFYTYKCEVFGGGAGNGITYQTCNDFDEFQCRVHDIKYVTGAVPSDDVINGIWYNNCYDFTVNGSRVYDCGAEVASVFTKKRSRGFAISGCYDFTFFGTRSVRVDQGHDITGGVGNHDFDIIGCLARDCNTYSFKAANSAYRGTYIGCIGDGARINFVVSGQTEVSNPRPRDITYIRCKAIDTGKNAGYPGVPAQGFRIQSVPTIDATYPRGIVYDNCIAADTQMVPTMEHGFAADVVTGTVAADINRVRNNCRSSGHTTAATVGFTDDNNITGTYRFDGTDPRHTFYDSDAAADEKMYETVLTGGKMIRRTLTDAGGSGMDIEEIDRNGTTITLLNWDGDVMKRGGKTVSVNRFEYADSSGRITRRYSDNSLHNIESWENFGITASGQGLSWTIKYGTGDALGGNAFKLDFRTTNTWAGASTRSSEFRMSTILADTVVDSFRITPRFVGYGALPMSYCLAQSAVAVAHTGTVAKTAVVTIPIPAGAMGPNGMVQFSVLVSMTNNANNKTFNVELDGTTFYGITVASQACLQFIGFIRNRNSEASQVGFTNSTSGIGAASLATGTVDTAIAKNLTIAITLANSGDTATVEGYTIEVIHGA